MLKKLTISGLVFVLFVSSVFAESDSWTALKEIAAAQKIQVVLMDLKSFEGEFASFDQDSISLQQKGKRITLQRGDVLRVSLRGPAKRKRNVLLGLAAGAGAGLAIGLISTSSDEGFEIISDQAITWSLTAIGAAAGATLGAAFPSHDYRTIYRAKTDSDGE